MKSKDKQITRKNLIALGIVVLFIIIILIFGQYILGSKIVKLESQIQSCQEKVPVWTLKIICYHTNYLGADTYNIIYESSHSNYQNYLNHLESVEELENCEVLSP